MRSLRLALAASCAAFVVVGCTSSDRADLTPASDALQQKVFDEFAAWTDWLERENAAGYVGEFGWPGDRVDSARWDALGELWLERVEAEDLWASAWATGSHWHDYPLAIHESDPASDGLSGPRSQATAIEAAAKRSGNAIGVNLAGLEFSTDGEFSSANPGEIDVDFFVEPLPSLEYLSSVGISSIRLPFRWERIQPVLHERLDRKSVLHLRWLLDAADDVDIDVILDLHNYGFYITESGPLQLGTPALPADSLIDVWSRIDDEFGDHHAVSAYGLMNEPSNFEVGERTTTEAELWETISAQTLEGLRSNGVSQHLLVAGYDWSSLSRWSENHPTGWIDDPENNFRYEAHHYWDSDASGTYELTYNRELSMVEAELNP